MTPQPAAEITLSSIGQIAVTVQDLPRAVAFYRDMLGMKYLFEVNDMAAFFDCGGIRLMLAKREQSPATYSSIVYYRVANIQETTDALVAKGVHLEEPARMIAKMPDHELWMSFFRDTEGNVLA